MFRWSGSSSQLQDTQPSQPSNVGYLPVIPASPAKLATVFVLPQKTLAMMQKLNHPDIIAVFDQALYAKVLEVQLKHPVLFKAIVPCMGAFHIACAFLAVLGRRFADAGLRKLLVESRTIGLNAVEHVLHGKQCNRAVCCHKTVMEAMFRVRWHEFTDPRCIMAFFPKIY